MNYDYWIGILECCCHSKYPTGGCLHCDLVRAKQQHELALEALKAVNREQMSALEGLNLPALIAELEEVK